MSPSLVYLGTGQRSGAAHHAPNDSLDLCQGSFLTSDLSLTVAQNVKEETYMALQ